MAKKSAKDSDEFSLDLKRLTHSLDFFKKNKKILLLLFLILFPMVMSIKFRVDSAFLPVTEDWATSSVHNGIRNNIANEVNQRYPNLPSQNKNELVDQQFQRILEEQGDAIDRQIAAGAQQFKARLQDEEGQTYLLAIDPYQWYRRTRNWVEEGNWYDEIKDGEPWNNHMYAPLGVGMDPAFHVSVTYYIYRMVNFLNPGLSLLTVLFYIPVLFAALSVIPAFFIARKKAGDLGGFAAATIVAVHTTFISRTAAGFSDTDAYNVFFPLLITWVFLEAFETNDWKKKIGLTSLAGLLMGLFSYAWNGWWYIFDFLVVVLGAYAGYVILRQILKHKLDVQKLVKSQEIRNTLIVGLAFVVSSCIFVTLFTNFQQFTGAPLEPIKFSVIKNAAKASLWPNVFTTVAELGNTSLGTIVGSIGGKTMFFLAALGVVLTMTGGKKTWKRDSLLVGASVVLLLLLVSDSFLGMNPIKYLIFLTIPLAIGLFLTLKDEEQIDVKYALFLTVWFAGTIYASTKGVRFILLLVPAFAVAFGIALGMIQEMVTRWMKAGLNINSDSIKPIVTIILLLLLIGPIKTAAGTGIREVPSMNDAWWASLDEIRQESEPDAIINSWWDFGHWFKAIADRQVTFDGASQNTPMAHWIGNALLTGDEKTAIGILRMLDCGSYDGFEKLNAELDDTVRSVDVVYEIIVLDKEGARSRLLKEDLTESKADEILSLTHCEPPENYFITSEDMVGKAGVWAHFGSWNFEKAYIYTNLRNVPVQQAVKEMQDKFGYTEEAATKTYYDVLAIQSEDQANAWISPWPNYLTPRWIGCADDNDTVTCSVGIRVSQQGNQQVVMEGVAIDMNNIENSTVFFGSYDTGTGAKVGSGLGTVQQIAIAGDEKIEVYSQTGQNVFPYTLLLDRQHSRMMLIHPLLAQSTFTKLFYLDGRYTEHFDKFSDKTSINGQRIIVWKVDWDGK